MKKELGGVPIRGDTNQGGSIKRFQRFKRFQGFKRFQQFMWLNTFESYMGYLPRCLSRVSGTGLGVNQDGR